jgi:tetratricopeptide (TPR) repeat protein
MDTVIAVNYSPHERAERFASAEAAATKALSLAPDHAWATLCMGIVLTLTNRASQGIAECERALALDRNLAHAQGYMGLAKFLLGRGEETVSHVQEALRISPRDARAYVWLTGAGHASVSLGRDQEAVEWLHRSIEMHRGYLMSHYALAAALANLDRLEEARTAVQKVLSLDPNFSIARLRATPISDNPIFLARRERLLAGLLKAGVPEG